MSNLGRKREIRRLAKLITNDDVFLKCLLDTDPLHREEVYDVIAPHVSYKPKPYKELIASAELMTAQTPCLPS